MLMCVSGMLMFARWADQQRCGALDFVDLCVMFNGACACLSVCLSLCDLISVA